MMLMMMMMITRWDIFGCSRFGGMASVGFHSFLSLRFGLVVGLRWLFLVGCRCTSHINTSSGLVCVSTHTWSNLPPTRFRFLVSGLAHSLGRPGKTAERPRERGDDDGHSSANQHVLRRRVVVASVCNYRISNGMQEFTSIQVFGLETDHRDNTRKMIAFTRSTSYEYSPTVRKWDSSLHRSTTAFQRLSLKMENHSSPNHEERDGNENVVLPVLISM